MPPSRGERLWRREGVSLLVGASLFRQMAGLTSGRKARVHAEWKHR